MMLVISCLQAIREPVEQWTNIQGHNALVNIYFYRTLGKKVLLYMYISVHELVGLPFYQIIPVKSFQSFG